MSRTRGSEIRAVYFNGMRNEHYLVLGMGKLRKGFTCEDP